jgi:hypothetical protein
MPVREGASGKRCANDRCGSEHAGKAPGRKWSQWQAHQRQVRVKKRRSLPAADDLDTFQRSHDRFERRLNLEHDVRTLLGDSKRSSA